MKNTYRLSRLLLGLILVVFGLNGFFSFIKPPDMSLKGSLFIRALVATDYMLPLWKGTEIVCGALLLMDVYVALAIVLVAPVVVNIFFFHLFLDRGNLVIGVVMAALTFFVGWCQRAKYRALFQIG